MKIKSIFALLSVALSTSTQTSKAQIQKGTIFLGGSSALNVNSIDNSSPMGTGKAKMSMFVLSPRAGYFISPNWAFGLGFQYTNNFSINNSFNAINNTTSKMKEVGNSLGLDLSARYNTMLSKRFAFFVHGILGINLWGKTKTTQELITSTSTQSLTTTNDFFIGESTNINLDIRPGVTYFVTPKFGIEANFASVFVRYSAVNPTPSNLNNKTSALNVGYNLYPSSFGLGVHYYLAPKPKKQVIEVVE